MALMAYADGSRKLREKISSAYHSLSSLDIGGNLAYILTTGFSSPTTDGGGLVTEHKGVFQDDEALVLSGSLATVAFAAGQAFIIGSSGAVIAGYTDTTTLVAEGFLTTADQQAELLRRTANHAVTSISGSGVPLDTPGNHSYSVSYVVRGDSGSKDISASDVEFVDLGNFTITYSTST
jgi:hypothetical protein